MFNILEKRFQKAIEKYSKKTLLKEEDILEITREIKLALLEADVNLKVVKEFISKVKEKSSFIRNNRKAKPITAND